MMNAYQHACGCSSAHVKRATKPRRVVNLKAPLFASTYRAEVLRFLASEEPGLTQETRQFWRVLGRIMTRDNVEALLRGGFTPDIQAAFQDAWSQYIERTLVPAWSASLAASAAASARPDLWATLTPQLAQEWLDTRAGNSLAGYTARQAQTINTLVRGALSQRLSAAQLQDILRVSVGLTPQHARALDAQVAQLIEAGATADQIRLATAAKADQLQRVRAGMIARTELASALNGGTQLAMQQAAGAGLLQNITRVWVAQLDARTCRICENLDGETAGLNDTFPGGYTVPPAHPRCRCVVLYEEA